MPGDWETRFREWAKPPGPTEKARCENAASAIRNAIKASETLRDRSVSVFAHGSYRNNTNVRKDSDVDIGVLCDDVFLNQFLEGTTAEMFGFYDSDYSYEQYKDEVEEALVDYFGQAAVTRGNKAFGIRETTYHVEADVAAFMAHRRYYKSGSHYDGVALLTDREKRRIVNWPEQHYENGVTKNTNTAKRFKGIVRVLKSLSNEMAEAGLAGADLPGFLIECMTWNAPHDGFRHASYVDNVRDVLAFLYNDTRRREDCQDWVEVSKYKYLFRSTQKSTWQEAHTFASVAWDYIGFER